MGLIIYGSEEMPIEVGEFLIFCPSCESHQWADIMVLSLYYHIYLIPIIPFDKNVNTICQNCELKSYGRNFDSKLISNYTEVQRNVRHPWYACTGIGFLLIIIIISVIVSPVKSSI
jgi:hypothetical protein